MRPHIRLAVLSLFLLVPASIICAQTSNLTGTVSMEQDYRTVNFNSPQGHVKVFLPGDLGAAGQSTVTLSGTVVLEPAGKTEKEKSENLKALQKMTLKIGANSIPVFGQHFFDFTLPGNSAVPVSIELSDPAGRRVTLMLSSPTC